MADLIDITTLRLRNILSYKGDLVYVSMLSLDIDDEYTELIGITPFGKTIGEKVEWIRSFGHDLKPVELTEDLLLKAGFNKYEGYDYWTSKPQNRVPIYENGVVNIIFSGGEYSYFVDAYDGGTSTDKQHVIDVESEHQIQNLYFALSGKELIIK